MKNLLLLGVTCLMLGACGNFYSKQPVDDAYYKKTQGIAWPTEQQASSSAPAKTTAKTSRTEASATSGSSSTSIPSGAAKEPEEKWHDATPASKKVTVPAAVEKKLECKKKGNESNTYTCRWGGRICGWGCKSDGSNCSSGYCLQSDCDDVMGQKWDWIEFRPYTGDRRFVCKHPDYPVVCYPYGSSGVRCEEKGYNYSFYTDCGDGCNKNGTECREGRNNCWDKYR